MLLLTLIVTVAIYVAASIALEVVNRRAEAADRDRSVPAPKESPPVVWTSSPFDR